MTMQPMRGARIAMDEDETVEDVRQKVRRAVRRAVGSAMTGADTWLHHPSFNTKTEVVYWINHARDMAKELDEVLNGRVGYLTDQFGVDWDQYDKEAEFVKGFKRREDSPRPIRNPFLTEK